MLIYVNSCLCSSFVNIETKFNKNIRLEKSHLRDTPRGGLWIIRQNLFISINFDIVIGNIYRSPSSIGDNDDELCKLISYISDKYPRLNFSDIEWDNSDIPRILNLVISNTEIVTSIEYLAPLGKSDHSLLVVYTNLQEQKELIVPRPNYSKGQYDELRQFLDLDWDLLLSLRKNDVENMWKVIKEKNTRRSR